MSSKLALYNDTLLALGQERLSALTDAVAARYAIDDTYDSALKYCLEQGFWNFAMRAVQADHSASVTPAFGYTYAFTKPDDFIRLHTMSADDTMTNPLLDFVDEPNYWFANSDPLYVKYVSDDVAYGRDLSIWPESFAQYVTYYLACKTCKRITGSEPSDKLDMRVKRALADSRSKDAMNEPPGFPPRGTWVTSRTRGHSSTRWDRSNR